MRYKPFASIPQSRVEFEHHLNLLKEKLKGDTIKFSNNMVHSLEGIKKVRFSPNRRINLMTVNETVRLLGNTIVNAMYSESLKNSDSRDTQEDELENT